jgi:hypothetical protein
MWFQLGIIEAARQKSAPGFAQFQTKQNNKCIKNLITIKAIRLGPEADAELYLPL